MKWSVGWGPVPYCNMNCEFCYSRSVRESEVSPYGLTAAGFLLGGRRDDRKIRTD